MIGVDERRLHPGEPGLRLRPQRVHRRLRAGQLARQAERHGQPRPALGAVPADVEHLFVGEPLRSVAVRPERPQHRVSAGAGRPDVPGRLGLSGRFDDVREEDGQFAPRVGVVWTPQGDERTSVRASWGVFYDTPHLFFNTRFANNPPWGAQITIANTAPGGFADPYLGYPGGNPFPALNTGWATQAFPAFGVYVNTPLHVEPTSLQQWNVTVQHQFGDWLAGVELPRQPLEPSLESDRAQSGGVRPWRDDRKHQPAARADSAERHAGSVLRDHRSARRHRTGQLRRHAALAPAPAQEQPERPLQLHAVEVHERSGDDGAHGSDDREPGEPGSGLRLLLVGPPARPERVAGRANAGFREQDGRGRSSATGRSRRSSAGSRATVPASPPAWTTR